MAFTFETAWQVAEVRGSAGGAPLLPHAWWLRARDAASLLLTALVHLLVMWLLVTRLDPEDATAVDPPVGRPAQLLSFEIAGASALPEPMLPPTAAAPAALPPEIDLSRASTLPRPEWSVARIAAASTPEVAASAAPAPVATGAGAGAGAGGGVYDPFAGAAPLRRDSAPVGPGPSEGAHTQGLDAAFLEALRAAVARAHPGSTGSVELTVRVSSGGAVVEARLRGGTAPADAREAMRRALVGKRIFAASSKPSRSIELPVLILAR